MALTLTEARAKVRRDLSDPHGDRWTDAEVDDALSDALQVAAEAYIAQGGDRFQTFVSATSTTSGTYDLETALGAAPVHVDVVRLVSGNTRYHIEQQPLQERERPDDTARSLEIVVTQRPVIGSSGANALVSSDGTNELGGNWPAFEALVCVEAALLLLPTDGHRVHPLFDKANVLRASVGAAVNVTRSRPAPGLSNRRGSFWDHLRWDYLPSTGLLYLHRVRYA